MIETPKTIADRVDADDPVVSIVCMTFNHAEYIAQALDSFLEQETTFPVEIIVHDDASSDETAQQIQEYASRHPRIFRITLQKTNQRSQGFRPLQHLLPTARGRYIAVCEGDDYWTSPTKLQLQFEALEKRPDAAACIHRADGRFEEQGETIPDFFAPPHVKDEYTIDDILAHENFVATSSLMLKADSFRMAHEWLSDVPYNDLAIISIAAIQGPILYIDRSLSVYRKHAGGLHSGQPPAIQAIRCFETLMGIGNNLAVSGRDSFREGLNFRVAQIESELNRYTKRVTKLEGQHTQSQKAIKEMVQSRTFRIGMTLGTLRSRLLGRR